MSLVIIILVYTSLLTEVVGKAVRNRPMVRKLPWVFPPTIMPFSAILWCSV